MLKFRKGLKDPTALLDIDRVTNLGAAGALVQWKLATSVLKWEGYFLHLTILCGLLTFNRIYRRIIYLNSFEFYLVIDVESP